MGRDSDELRRRGRPPRPEPAEPTGYRVTEAVRRELDLARAFTGHKSNQAVIDTAVRSYLLDLRADKDTYRTAAEALDLEMGGRADNVEQIQRARRRPRR